MTFNLKKPGTFLLIIAIVAVAVRERHRGIFNWPEFIGLALLVLFIFVGHRLVPTSRSRYEPD